MKTYLDLLDTKFDINVEMLLTAAHGHAKVILNGDIVFDGAIAGQQVIQHTVPLLDPIRLEIQHSGVELASMRFDQWEARPQHGEYQPGTWRFNTDIPFYQWWHHATAQGWLLRPQ